MLHIKQAVIVEGRYDKIKLSSLIDAFIVETNGFSVFKDKERLNFIRKLAKEQGIIILTDSDHAGFMIRNYISKGIDKKNIINIYIPDIYGKEKRKSAPSKEGKLGVEGMTKEIIVNAFKQAQIAFEDRENPDPLTNFDLYEAGLSGVPNAVQNKKKFLKALDLPEFLSTNSLLTYINYHYTKEEFNTIISNL